MRLKASHFGLLVRPKTIMHMHFYVKSDVLQIDEWWKNSLVHHRWHTNAKRNQLTHFYKKSVPNLFSSLMLGNTKLSPSTSYVCQITSFLVLKKGLVHLLDTKEKVDAFQQETIKRFGRDAYLPVVGVGLKFYNGFIPDTLSPINPWPPTDSNETIWFYQPKEIIPLENVVTFESIAYGDFIGMRKQNGIVTEVKEFPNKPSFYSSNSCVSRMIILLSSKSKFYKLQPDKRFRIAIPFSSIKKKTT